MQDTIVRNTSELVDEHAFLSQGTVGAWEVAAW